MITESDARRYDNRTTIVWSLCASLLVNLFAWTVALWLAGLNVNLVLPQRPRPEFVVSSSSVTISHRTRPRPQERGLPHMTLRATQPQPQPRQPSPSRSQRQVALHRPARQESVKTLALQLAEQEQAFEKTAQQLRAQSQILSTATSAPVAPSTFRRSYMDLNGRDPRESVEAVLEPLPGPTSHWVANGQSCYYVHYYAQYSGGGNEQGTIPWPVCYPANHDAMLPLNRVHDLPIPSPPVGYVLPPGSALGPLLMRIYTGAIHS